MTEILHGDCLTELRKLEPSSVDSLVSDPPAGISFMGKDWDSDKGGRDQWIAWMTEVMRECLRVLKPGAHGLVWAIPRTSHWTATALENAGFEVRDVVTHIFGSGFPKSLDVSKAIDKAAGAEREITGRKSYSAPDIRGNAYDQQRVGERERLGVPITAPATEAAKQWQGWGTALKPASEHWILVRKPLSEKTVAKNVERWGTGAINVDGCRIESGADYHDLKVTQGGANCSVPLAPPREVPRPFKPASGRFPANIVLSHTPYCTDDQCDIECAIQEMDRQTAHLHSAGFKKPKTGQSIKRDDSIFRMGNQGTDGQRFGDSGGASRFFYCAKPSRVERNAGCDGLPKGAAPASARSKPAEGRQKALGEPRSNHHPTVKPVKLMCYLIRMITPPGGQVLDPFTGSGTTGIAAVKEGMRFIGIEREAEYVQIAEKRIYHAIPKIKKQMHGKG